MSDGKTDDKTATGRRSGVLTGYVLRWLLFIPAGLFESFLLILAFFCAALGRWHKPAEVLAKDIIKYAMTMPDLKWYFG